MPAPVPACRSATDVTLPFVSSLSYPWSADQPPGTGILFEGPACSLSSEDVASHGWVTPRDPGVPGPGPRGSGGRDRDVQTKRGAGKPSKAHSHAAAWARAWGALPALACLPSSSGPSPQSWQPPSGQLGARPATPASPRAEPEALLGTRSCFCFVPCCAI